MRLERVNILRRNVMLTKRGILEEIQKENEELRRVKLGYDNEVNQGLIEMYEQNIRRLNNDLKIFSANIHYRSLKRVSRGLEKRLGLRVEYYEDDSGQEGSYDVYPTEKMKKFVAGVADFFAKRLAESPEALGYITTSLEGQKDEAEFSSLYLGSDLLEIADELLKLRGGRKFLFF